jgi:hypothetical protein
VGAMGPSMDPQAAAGGHGSVRGAGGEGDAPVVAVLVLAARRHRWVVERTFAWLHNRRRLLIRTDRRDDIHEGFLALACCLICWRRLETSSS